mmetsp:Transcript_10291/g.13076  ORF Transcript_10291/g.13076 Transcript_10291/m.13076 type:complete len:474 (+) Transcript_10291:54-1475(+)
MGACGSALMKPCLGETDVRYDANYPKTIVETDARWEKLTGYFKVNVTSFDPVDGGAAQPGPYIESVIQTHSSPFDASRTIAFYNHTVDGSRLIVNRYYFKPPAPFGFCQIPFEPPAMNAQPGSTCGVNGQVDFAGVYASLTHEHDGTLKIGRATGSYANSEDGIWDTGEGSYAKLTDDSTFEFSFVRPDEFSSVSSFVFFDDDTASLSAVHTTIPMQRIVSANTATMVRISEEEFLAGIEEYNEAFQVPQPIQAPMTSDEVAKYDGTFPAEEDWCGGVMSDVSCTPSPYVEPDAQMKGGVIALFVILGVLLFSSVALFFHRKAIDTQKKRYKEHFIRGIARNITISDSAGRVSPEQLKKEFDHIDKDKGGTISKDELKTFLKSGKVGDISDKDVEAMWAAIDIDNSGEVDFVEFIAFLGSCGTEFESISKEQKAMSKAEKLKYASQRLSTRCLVMPPDVDKSADEEKEGEENA